MEDSFFGFDAIIKKLFKKNKQKLTLNLHGYL